AGRVAAAGRGRRPAATVPRPRPLRAPSAAHATGSAGRRRAKRPAAAPRSPRPPPTRTGAPPLRPPPRKGRVPMEQALDRSKLEQKDRAELAAIVEAMGGKAPSRAKKADL